MSGQEIGNVYPRKLLTDSDRAERERERERERTVRNINEY
jgi:hypothetical protein